MGQVGLKALKKIMTPVSNCMRKINVANRRGWIEEGMLSWKGLVGLLAAVCFVWIIYGTIISISYEKMEDRGLSGDMFGGITALFSGLAFAGLVFTLFVQKKELQYQREELGHLVEEQRQTKGHLKDQASHLKSQSEFIERQIFENSFFQLLGSFAEFVSQISYREKNGADALELVCASVRPISHVFGDALPLNSVSVIANYEINFENHKNDLAPYFRLIYNVLKFIDRSEVENKEFYSNLLRAMLNSSELTLMALNCASCHGSEKMSPLVQKFNLLKHFDDFSLFEEKAFDQSMVNYFQNWNFVETALRAGRIGPAARKPNIFGQ